MTISRLLNYGVLFSMLLVLPLPTLAEVYKWQDKDGNTVYGDQPPTPTAKKIKIKQAPPQDKSYRKRLNKRQKLLDTMNEERADKAAEEQKIAERKAKQEKNCERVRTDLSTMKNAGFLYEETDDPLNPSILTDAQREQEQKRYQQYLDENC